METRVKRKKWIRIALVSVSVIVILLVGVVVFLPTILSGSFGRNMAVGFISPLVRGKVSLAELSLSWSGPQIVRGLSIQGADGASISLDITAHNGLIGLARSTEAPSVVLSGVIATAYRPDGSLSLTDLFVAPESVTTATTSTAQPSTVQPPTAPSRSLAETLRGVVLEITNLQLTATGSGADTKIEIRRLKGKCSVEDAGVRAEFSATTQVGAKSGSLSLKGLVGNIFATDGSIDINGASIDLDLQASTLAIPAQGLPLEINSLSFKIVAPKFAQSVHISGNTVIQLPTGELANSTINIEASDPMDALKRSFAGTIAVVNLPTSALAPYLSAPIDAQRDLGSSLNANITLEGRSGSIDASSQTLSIKASGGISADGKVITLDQIALRAQVHPALMPASLGVASSMAVAIQGTAVALPIPSAGSAMAWKDARMNFMVSIEPVVLKPSATLSLAIGATTIEVRTTDPTKEVSLQMQSSVDGSSITLDQVVTGLVNANGLAIESAVTKGRLQLAPIALASAQWLDDNMRATLKDAGITAVSLGLTNEGSQQEGTATISVGLDSTNIATKLVWNKTGISTDRIELALAVQPALVARFAGSSVVLSQPAQLTMRIAPLSATWSDINSGRPAWQKMSAEISASAIEIATAPGLVHGGSLRDVNATVQLTPLPDGSIAGIDQAQLSAKLFDGTAQAATIVASIRMPSFATKTFDSAFEVTIAAGDKLATMVDAGEGAAALVGPGAIKGSFNREQAKDSFVADITLPRLALKTSGSMMPGDSVAGAPAAVRIDLAKTTGKFALPAEIVEQALGLRTGVDWRALVANTGGRSISGSLDIDSCRWTGRADDASVVASIVLDPGSIAPPNRAEISFGKVTMSVKSPRLAQRAQATIDGQFKVGTSANGNLAIALDTSGDLRAILGAKDVPLALKASTLSVKVPGALALALSDWHGGSSSLSQSITQLGDINAAFNIKTLTLPIGAATTGSADLRMDLAAIVIEPVGKPKLSLGAMELIIKSSGFDREMNVGIDGTFQVGDSSPGPISAGIAASGDLRSLLGAPENPLVLQASEMQIKIPGSLALAAIDWSRGNKDASAALKKLGPIDASVHITALSIPASGLIGGAIDCSLDIAPIEVEPAGQAAISLGATNAVIRSPRIGDSLALSLTVGGAKGGSISIEATGRGLTSATGAFDALAAAWTVKARATKIATALVDAAAGQGGELVAALGPDIDATVDAAVVTAADGTPTTAVTATVKTQYLTIDAPKVNISRGRAIITPENPLALTFTINKVLQRKLLAPLNPVLADIRTAPPIQLRVTQASYPLDGNLATLDLDARVDVGDVEVVRSNQTLGILALAQSANSDTVPARIEPLIVTVRQGLLRYDNFVVKAGRVGDQWQQVLKLSGDIDLRRIPPYANAITCRYPISSIGRTAVAASSSVAPILQNISAAIKQLPVDPGDLLQVDVTLSGPLGEVNGKPVPLNSQVKLVFDASAIDGKAIQKGIGDILKLFGK